MHDICENKYRKLFKILNLWIYLRNMGVNLAECPLISNAESIAVYGAGEVGRRLCEEFYNEGITVKYVVDRNKPYSFSGIKHYYPWEELPNVDLMIITTITDNQNILESIRTCNVKNLVFFDDLLNGRYYSLFNS